MPGRRELARHLALRLHQVVEAMLKGHRVLLRASEFGVETVGTMLRALGTTLRVYGTTLRVLGTTLGALGTTLGVLGTTLGALGAPAYPFVLVAQARPIRVHRPSIGFRLFEACADVLSDCLVGPAEGEACGVEFPAHVVEHSEGSDGCRRPALQLAESVTNLRHPSIERRPRAELAGACGMVAQVGLKELCDGRAVGSGRPRQAQVVRDPVSHRSPVGEQLAVGHHRSRNGSRRVLGVEHVSQPHQQRELGREPVARGERSRYVNRVSDDENGGWDDA